MASSARPRERSCSETSSRSARGSSPVSRSVSRSMRDEVGLGQLAAADVDAHGEARSARQLAPVRELRAGGPQHLAAERDGQPRLLGHGQDFRRLAMRPARRAPRSRRCGPSPPARSAGSRPPACRCSIALPQVALQVEPAHDLLVHLGVEDRVAALAVGLGAVHRDVGVAHHLLGRGLRAVASAIPIDAPMNSSRPSSRNGACRLCRTRSAMIVASRALADVVEQQRELVAAEAGDGVVGPQRRLEPARDRLAAAGRRRAWPSESLTTLKRSRSRNSTAAQHSGWWRWARRIDLVEAVDEQDAVGQAGERVVQRVVLQPALGLAAVGDVGERADDAGRAARRRRAPRSPRASIQR